MEDVNRLALVVHHTQRLVDWVNTIFPDAPVYLDFEADDSATVYLIPEFYDLEDARKWLRKNFKPILERALEDWCTDPALWPRLSWKTFETFLNWQIHSMVLDIGATKQPRRKTATRASGNTSPSSDVLELEISLDNIQPKIWRRVQIDPNTTFLELHYIIQFALGWTNSHLHRFLTDDELVCIGVPYLMDDSPYEFLDSQAIYVSDFIQNPGDQLQYEYDFGDGWMHTLTLLQRIPSERHRTIPVVADGARACPPEDCGGIWGYQQMVEALKKPRSSEAQSYKAWLGYVYKPEHFDLEAVNRRYFGNFRKVWRAWDDYANK